MLYNYVTDSVHTKKLCSRLSSSKLPVYTKNSRSVFGLGATYDVHLRCIGKLVVDFLLVITELFR